MTRVNSIRLVILALGVVSSACAKQRFATRFALVPVLTAAHPEMSEFDRRELERSSDVAVLNSERNELAQALREVHGVWVDQDPSLTGYATRWADLTPRDRTEVDWALERILFISRRVHFLTNRSFGDDELARRALVRLKSLRKYKPRPSAYYGH